MTNILWHSNFIKLTELPKAKNNMTPSVFCILPDLACWFFLFYLVLLSVSGRFELFLCCGHTHVLLFLGIG